MSQAVLLSNHQDYSMIHLTWSLTTRLIRLWSYHRIKITETRLKSAVLPSNHQDYRIHLDQTRALSRVRLAELWSYHRIKITKTQAYVAQGSNSLHHVSNDTVDFSFTHTPMYIAPHRRSPIYARQQASHEKRRRYYERHRDAILLRHRLGRMNNTPSITAESNMNDLLDDEVDFEAIVTLSDCLGLVRNAKNKVLAIVPSGIPTVYVEDVLRKYAMLLHTSVMGDLEILRDRLKLIEPYLIWAQQGQDKIFNMCGICDEWRAANEVSSFIGHLVAMLEDLYRLAVWGDLDEAYLLGETMYQKVLGLEAPGVWLGLIHF
ncbi:hypothetical protein F4604DRAFT_1689164 [Suillus subluteus]|nr:hypothetical protein F4604DRAFT_1689164 [Suillus subluteus]